MALSNKSLLQAKKVLSEILESNVDVIVTRASLDKIIELVKFPYLKSSHDKNPKNRTLYISQQYDPIRYWLVKNGFLRQEFYRNSYMYYVDRIAIIKYLHSGEMPKSGYSTKRGESLTIKEQTFRHIEANGNAMRYTDIIKFVYENKYGHNSFNKKENRGFYSGAFRKNATYYNHMPIPDGHFVKENPKGYLVKLANGLWSVCRPMMQSKKTEERIPKDEYESMRLGLATYGITSYDFDSLATKYYNEGNDISSAYSYAYYDLLNKAGAVSETTKELQNEIDQLIEDSKNNESYMNKKKYAVVSLIDSVLSGILNEDELKLFFSEDRDVCDYMIFEAGKPIIIEKKITTTIEIK